MQEEIFQYKIRTKKDKIPLVLLGDIHFGHNNTNVDKLNEYIQWIKKNQAFTILMGDLLETAIPTHIPQTMWSQRINPTDQMDRIYELLEPIKDTIISSVCGNHELRIYNTTEIDVSKIISDKLGCYYIKDGGFLQIKLNDIMYNFAIFHGSGSSCNPRHQLLKALNIWSDMDICALGHMHQLYDEVVWKYKIESDKKIKHPIHLIRTGGFLEYPDYAQRAFFPLANVGAPILELYTKNKAIEVDTNGLQ